MSYGKAIVVGGLLAAGALYISKKFCDWAENQVARDAEREQHYAQTLGTPEESNEGGVVSNG